MLMKIRKFQIKFFLKIHKELIQIKQKKQNKTFSKTLLAFSSNKSVLIDAEFVSSFERVSKLTLQNAFFNENIFFRNYESERNENRREQSENRREQNENEIEQNKNERRVSKKNRIDKN